MMFVHSCRKVHLTLYMNSPGIACTFTGVVSIVGFEPTKPNVIDIFAKENRYITFAWLIKPFLLELVPRRTPFGF